MALAIFDLDHTLLDGDSDFLWGIFLCEEYGRDIHAWKQGLQEFDHAYRLGEVDIDAYLRYSLQTLSWSNQEALLNARKKFQSLWIAPRITPDAREKVRWHMDQDHQVIIATATNRFVAEASHRELRSHLLFATEIAKDSSGFRHKQPACFGQHKISHIQSQLGAECFEEQESWFYSDSINDLPLLENVTHPHVINPDEKLRKVAAGRQWPITTWRRGK